MKSLLLITALFCGAKNFSQDCTGYYFLQNNKTVEMTIYNKKGKEAGKQQYHVSDVNTSGGITSAKVNSEMFNEKGKSIAKSAATIKCDNGVMMIDMKMSMPPSPNSDKSPTAETDVRMDKFYVEYPADMKVGDNLKDAKMDMDMDSGNGIQQSVNMEVNNRKVEAKEKVTTAAGSWDCYKISFKSKMRIKTMGIGIPVNIEGVEWFAPSFGIVKTESNHGRTEISAVK